MKHGRMPPCRARRIGSFPQRLIDGGRCCAYGFVLMILPLGERTYQRPPLRLVACPFA